MFTLKVITPFRDRNNVEHIYRKGEVLHMGDLDRVNDLVGCKLCVITGVEPTQAETSPLKEVAAEKVDFQGSSFDLDVIKGALATIGVSVAANAKVKGVENALSKLSEDQIQALTAALSTNKA